MSNSAEQFLRRVRDFHRDLQRLYAGAAAIVEQPRVAMLLDYVGDGHRDMGTIISRNLRSVSPGLLEKECCGEFDLAALSSGVSECLHTAMSFDEVMSIALRTDRQLHAVIESAADNGEDPRLKAVLRQVLQQSREMRNRLSFNAGQLRDF